MKRHARLSLVLILLSTTGCGTLFGRGDADRSFRHGYYYLGTKYDWRMLSLEGNGAAYDYTPELCYITLICPIALLLSIPVDAAIDTALIYSDKQSEQRFERGLAAYNRSNLCSTAVRSDKENLDTSGRSTEACPAAVSDYPAAGAAK